MIIDNFEEVVDQALASARRTLLEEHEKQMTRCISDSMPGGEARRDSASNASSNMRTAGRRSSNQSYRSPMSSSRTKELLMQWRQEAEEERPVSTRSPRSRSVSRRHSLSSCSLHTLNAIIEAATAGGRQIETRTLSERLWEMVKNGFWDTLMGMVIILNTATLGLSTDLHPEWPGWFVIEAIFAAIFLLEMLVKVCRKNGLRLYFFGTCWRWNIFEFVLVILALLEVGTGLQSQNQEADTRTIFVFRLFRLARIARILRMSRLSVFSDLLMIIHGASGGMRTFLWSVLLISLPLYSVALVLTDSLKDSLGSVQGAELFNNVGTSFFTVFRCVVGNDCTDVEGRPIFLSLTQKSSAFYGLLYCLVMLVFTFGLFNVIVAIYVENIVAAAKFNDAHSKRQRLRDAELFTEKITQMVKFIWSKHLIRSEEMLGKSVRSTNLEVAPEVASLEITPDFLNELRGHEEFQDILRDLDVADEDQLDLFDTLDVDGGGTIDLEELITGIAKLRGDARRSDIVSVGLVVRSLQQSMLDLENRVIGELRSHSETIKGLEAQSNVGRRASILQLQPPSMVPQEHLTAKGGAADFDVAADVAADDGEKCPRQL